MDALEQYFDSFDIMNIPLETRKKWYKSYEATDILLTDLAISAYDDEGHQPPRLKTSQLGFPATGD